MSFSNLSASKESAPTESVPKQSAPEEDECGQEFFQQHYSQYEQLQQVMQLVYFDQESSPHYQSPAEGRLSIY